MIVRACKGCTLTSQWSWESGAKADQTFHFFLSKVGRDCKTLAKTYCKRWELHMNQCLNRPLFSTPSKPFTQDGWRHSASPWSQSIIIEIIIATYRQPTSLYRAGKCPIVYSGVNTMTLSQPWVQQSARTEKQTSSIIGTFPWFEGFHDLKVFMILKCL